NITIFFHKCVDLFGCIALTDNNLRIDTDGLANLLRRLCHNRVSFLARFRTHDGFHTQPLLEVTVSYHKQQNQPTVGVLSPTPGIANSTLAFRRTVDHRHELASVAFKL